MKSELLIIRKQWKHILWTCAVTAIIAVCILIVTFEVSFQRNGVDPTALQWTGALALLALPILSFALYFVGSLEGKIHAWLTALSIWLAMGIAYFAYSPLEAELRNVSMAAAEQIQTKLVQYHQINGHYPASIEVAMGNHPPMHAPTLVRRVPFYYEPSTGRIGFDKPQWGSPTWTKRPGEEWREKDWRLGE